MCVRSVEEANRVKSSLHTLSPPSESREPSQPPTPQFEQRDSSGHRDGEKNRDDPENEGDMVAVRVRDAHCRFVLGDRLPHKWIGNGWHLEATD